METAFLALEPKLPMPPPAVLAESLGPAQQRYFAQGYTVATEGATPDRGHRRAAHRRAPGAARPRRDRAAGDPLGAEDGGEARVRLRRERGPRQDRRAEGHRGRLSPGGNRLLHEALPRPRSRPGSRPGAASPRSRPRSSPPRCAWPAPAAGSSSPTPTATPPSTWSSRPRRTPGSSPRTTRAPWWSTASSPAPTSSTPTCGWGWCRPSSPTTPSTGATTTRRSSARSGGRPSARPPPRWRAGSGSRTTPTSW